MVENPPGEELSCAPRLSDAAARKHLQTRGRNSSTWRSPNAHPDPPPKSSGRIQSCRPLPPPSPPPAAATSCPRLGSKSLGFGKREGRRKQKSVETKRHVAANPISGGRGGDKRRGFGEALHLKSQATAKQAAASIARRKMLPASLKK